MGVVTTLPRGRELTRAELEALPDDGWRHELVDGALIMTPAPSLRHQVVVGRLHLLLEASRPADLMVLFAPFDVTLADDSVLQPDLSAGQARGLHRQELRGDAAAGRGGPLPEHAHHRPPPEAARYEAAGCPSYWVVDPDVPSVTAWELRDGSYVEVGRAVDDEELAARPALPRRTPPGRAGAAGLIRQAPTPSTPPYWRS